LAGTKKSRRNNKIMLKRERVKTRKREKALTLEKSAPFRAGIKNKMDCFVPRNDAPTLAPSLEEQ
jgi:hypothetical protein